MTNLLSSYFLLNESVPSYDLEVISSSQDRQLAPLSLLCYGCLILF